MGLAQKCTYGICIVDIFVVAIIVVVDGAIAVCYSSPTLWETRWPNGLPCDWIQKQKYF